MLPLLMTEFVPSYPKVSLSVHLVDGQVDVVGGGFDVALIVAEKLEDSGLTAQRLSTTRRVLAASPDYLKRHESGSPHHPSELTVHRCLDIGYARKKVAAWPFMHKGDSVDVEVPLSMTANNYLVLNLAACLNAGFVYLPELYVKSDVERGRLVHVLPECSKNIDWGLYAVYATRNPPEKVHAFIDFIRARTYHLEKRDRWMPLARQHDDA